MERAQERSVINKDTLFSLNLRRLFVLYWFWLAMKNEYFMLEFVEKCDFTDTVSALDERQKW